MAKYACPDCRKNITATKNDCYRTHSDGEGEPCEMSSVEIPQHVLDAGPVDAKAPADVPVEGVDFAVCPQCTRKVQLTRLGYFEPHDETLRGGDRCPVSGVRAKHARRFDDVPLPGDGKPKPGAAIPEVSAQEEITSPAPTSTNAGAASSPTELPPTSGTTENDWSKVGDLTHPSVPPAESSASTAPSSPESTTTSTPSPPSTSDPSTSSDAVEVIADAAPFSLGVSVSDRFLQPPEYTGPVKGEPMGPLAVELATKIKETFYAYSNRKTSDNRSAQTTLGPSEIGTPCDRRLAMALLGAVPVNPGGDGWAAFVGTCTHAGMAEVYTFADAGTGRYAVELPVFLGMPTVPRGTTDLLDRRDATVIDWKVMGKYSLDKFKKEGPTATYRTQAHVYGLGAEKGGEKVRNVAVVGLPRAGASLDEMHIWTEKYDRKFAQAALARVERISNDVQARYPATSPSDVKPEMLVAETFPTADDCRYCPFHLKNDKEMLRGCPGHKSS